MGKRRQRLLLTRKLALTMLLAVHPTFAMGNNKIEQHL
jgi:hypothetical protein